MDMVDIVDTVFCSSNDVAMLKQLGYASSDAEARETLHLLDTGEALAKGNISTDMCPLDYPVKFTVIPNGAT
ncbi:MAG: hypothetical protein NC299_16595 [Lachnospiraceae bacterium]|nr:hypothetical protein [Ruminococcus sp.]MCM1276956.1 hypothetical protein [Lachnospiraceae bacterium]